ncbi:MAG: LysR family transcriptional regulator [Proteobacteria bacterium]|nr:LysR family transcriptional regulator [Pseudomonadota bacterium]
MVALRETRVDPVSDVLKHLKLRHLTVALDVARLGSVRAAADVLCVTESAVSKTLRELEEQLGVRLFERTKDGMLLTEAGRRFSDYAHSALATLQTGLSIAGGERQGPRVTLRIGAMTVVTATFLPEVVRRFVEDLEGCLVEIASGTGDQLLHRLRAGEVDVVLGRCPPLTDMSALAFDQLYTDRHVFVVRKGHPLANAGALAPSQIAAYPIVMPPRQSLFWGEIHQLFVARGVEPRAAQIEVLDLQFCRTYTFKTDAVWIASERVVTNDLYAGALARLPIEAAGLEVPVGVITRRAGTPPPQVRRFIGILHDAAG